MPAKTLKMRKKTKNIYMRMFSTDMIHFLSAEFAIGTNTTAYMMGLKYNISGLLPILIAEKTGPHFGSR